MARFIGRQTELAALDDQLGRVAAGLAEGRAGRALLIRGRRRVGKSRLVEEFIDRVGTPSVYFTAVGGSRGADLEGFVLEVGRSTLPGAALAASFAVPTTWDAAFGILAAVLPTDTPSIVVLDEVPYLTREDPTFEGSLQKAFDRLLVNRPVLLVLVGSDMAMMEQLNAYGRPFHQRGTELVVPPLSPRDVAGLTGLPAAEAFDAYLVSGGLPLVLDEWSHGQDVWTYLESALSRPTSALIVSAERALAAEFPGQVQARTVLGAIGYGERTFTMIGRAAGNIPAQSLTRAIDLLTHRRIVASERPLSTKPSNQTRYRIADPYLRFWLSFIGPRLPLLERGRSDLVLKDIRTSWASWRGRAIEPVVRESLGRMRDQPLLDDSAAIGGYWTRTNDPEIDLVGADRSPVASRITFVGSIKWHEQAPFDDHDTARLIQHRSQLPGATDATPLIAVSRTGATTSTALVVEPESLLTAW